MSGLNDPNYEYLDSEVNFFIQNLGTADFYGLQFVDTGDELANLNEKLISTPNILIEGSKMVLDYSDIGDSTDKTNINTTFTSMNVGDGFTVSNAIYSDIVRNYSADLSASCTLASYNDYKIIANFYNVGTTSGLDYYLAKYFETIPQLTTNATLTGPTGTNKLINFTTSPDTSFLSNNFAANDYVDFATTSNTGRYVIYNINVDGNNREIVEFSSTNPLIKEENLKATKVTAEHYRKVNISDRNPVDVGSITTYNVSTESINGRNYFTIDGTAQNNLTVFRGNMYVFIEDAYPTHVLAFSTTPDGSHNNGTAYTNYGIYTVLDNSINKRITFLVPNNNIPNTLYYYCTYL